MAINAPTASSDPTATRPLLEFQPQVLGTGTTNVFGVNCRLRSGQINNPTNAAITVQVQDGQGTPIYLVPPVPLSPGGVININPMDDGYPCYNGLVIVTSASGLHAYFRGTPGI